MSRSLPPSDYRSPFVLIAHRTLRQRLHRVSTPHLRRVYEHVKRVTYRDAERLLSLAAQFRDDGSLGQRRGWQKLSASTNTRGRGRTTPGTATEADSSFWYPRGAVSAVMVSAPATLPEPRSESNFYAPGSFGSATAARGASGAPLRRAGSLRVLRLDGGRLTEPPEAAA